MFSPDFKTIQPIPFGSMVTQAPIGAQAGDQQNGRRAFLGRAHKRRFASLQAAAEAAELLPGELESVHVIMNGAYDLMHVLVVLLQRFNSPCAKLGIATLSLSARNVQELVALYDQGAVKQLELLVSDFAKKHDRDIVEELVREFSARGQRTGAARSHCKLATIALEDCRRYTLEGSPNLRTNKNAEQFCLTRDRELYGFYDGWLTGTIATHEIRPKDDPATG